MRSQHLKMQRQNSTKYERRFMELLKEKHIRFRAKVHIQGREVDFIVHKYAIDIDGHAQCPNKNEMLAHEGYIPVHYNNAEISNKLDITYLCQ